MNEEKHGSRKAVRGRTKRYLVAVVALFLALAISTTALAANGNGITQATLGADAQSGATKKPPSGGNGNGGVNGGGSQNSNRNKAKIGAPNFDKIAKAIAAMTDESVKANLTALLTAYESAWTAKQDAVAANDTTSLDTLTAAFTAAKDALDSALASAGVTLDAVYGVPTKALDGSNRAEHRPTLDAEKVLAAIATLDDTNADKATLTALLNEYQLALAAQTQADFASLTEQARLELAYAVRSAEEALLLAARDAGIIGGNGRGQFVSGFAYGKEQLDVTSILASIAALSDTDANKATLTELLTAYNAAVQAEAAADKSALSDAQFDALHDATEAAQEALIEALIAAGIDVPMIQPEQQPHAYTPSYSDDDDESDEDDDD